MTTHDNPAFEDDGLPEPKEGRFKSQISIAIAPSPQPINQEQNVGGRESRELWGKEIEFLLSCIAMSVGLGNVWRFPFTALENGGGAFLIPYLIVLFLVGKPIYYLEMIIGQFSSRGAVKVWDLCPALRGIGVGQIIMVFTLGTYYASLMSLISYYMVESVQSPLPWSQCRAEWGLNCLDSASGGESVEVVRNLTNMTLSYSSELYFVKEVLHEKDNINDGIGLPNWELVIGLFVSWAVIFLIIIRGVKSSGKASYFLAIFPYVVLAILLIRALTLEGSLDGIIYFIKPQWGQILNPKVWYAAVTQVFYSLSVCFGNIIMYSSYNKFGHNVHRDATIVTLLDTFTSLLAGFTIFGILGHLAHEVGTTDIGSVVKGGTGLAFISYPDAIAKFKDIPQAFSLLFFAMLFVLGVGSNIAMTSCTITAIRDNFPQIKQWVCALGLAVISFIIGLLYVTPGGQFILNLVDYFGASMIALVIGIVELYALGWIYGTKRLCKDTEFMIGLKVGVYWRICWSIVTPLIMTAILVYTFVSYEPLTYKDIVYPNWAYIVGWTIAVFGILQMPIWAVIAIYRQPGGNLKEKIVKAFKPQKDWGPTDPIIREKYLKEIELEKSKETGRGFFAFIKNNVCG
ncbi:hypothetical protein ACFFRR_007967 [Megaselia abdita]